MRIKITTTSEIFWLGKSKVPYNFAVMVRVRGEFSDAQLHTALARICERHPLVGLRVEIHENGEGWLVSDGVPPVPVRVIANAGPDDWQAVVLDELGECFDTQTGPLVRLVLLRGVETADLVLVFNHYICDGMSGAYLTRDLIQLLGEPDLPLARLHSPLCEMIELVPAQVKAHYPNRLQFWAIRRMMPVARFIQKRLPQTALQTALQTGDLPHWKHFCLLAWPLTPAQTSTLIARCHAEGTTVHTAICAAFLKADAEIEAISNRGQKRWKRKVSSSINIRKHLADPVGESFGIFMSTMTIPVNCQAERDFWDIARDLKLKMKREMRGDRIFLWLLRTHAAAHGMSRADRKGIIDALSIQPPGYDLAVSNLGCLDFPVQIGPLQVEAMYGPLVNGFPLERTVSVLTFGGVMYFSFAFRDFVLDQPTAELIKARAMQILGEAAGWEPAF